MENLPFDLPTLEPGSVWLVGAGPGNPGLICLTAVYGIKQADIIVYDALVGEEILKLAGPDTVLEYAGKRGGRPSSEQTDISERLVTLAKENKRVLRLKGGDPFVFGRGAEECFRLLEAEIPFQIVPGITAGAGGLAYAGIPLTTRGTNTAVTFITGHTAGDDVPRDFDWEGLAKGSPALVFYMGASKLAQIAERLMEAGRAATEPVAVISRATLPNQAVLESTLESAAEDLRASGLEAPILIVVGPIVGLREKLNWLEQ